MGEGKRHRGDKKEAEQMRTPSSRDKMKHTSENLSLSSASTKAVAQRSSQPWQEKNKELIQTEQPRTITNKNKNKPGQEELLQLFDTLFLAALPTFVSVPKIRRRLD